MRMYYVARSRARTSRNSFIGTYSWMIRNFRSSYIYLIILYSVFDGDCRPWRLETFEGRSGVRHDPEAVIDVTYKPLPFWNDHMTYFQVFDWLKTIRRHCDNRLSFSGNICFIRPTSEPLQIFDELYVVFTREHTLFSSPDVFASQAKDLDSAEEGHGRSYHRTVEHRKMCCS